MDIYLINMKTINNFIIEKLKLGQNKAFNSNIYLNDLKKGQEVYVILYDGKNKKIYQEIGKVKSNYNSYIIVKCKDTVENKSYGMEWNVSFRVNINYNTKTHKWDDVLDKFVTRSLWSTRCYAFISTDENIYQKVKDNIEEIRIIWSKYDSLGKGFENVKNIESELNKLFNK